MRNKILIHHNDKPTLAQSKASLIIYIIIATATLGPVTHHSHIRHVDFQFYVWCKILHNGTDDMLMIMW